MDAVTLFSGKQVDNEAMFLGEQNIVIQENPIVQLQNHQKMFYCWSKINHSEMQKNLLCVQ